MTDVASSIGESSKTGITPESTISLFLRGRVAGSFLVADSFFLSTFFFGFSTAAELSTPSPKSSSWNNSGAPSTFFLRVDFFFFFGAALAVALLRAFGFTSSALELLELLVGIRKS